MTTQMRVAAGVPTGGEFAAHDRPDAELALPFEVTTTSGWTTTVTPGVLDAAAEAYYTQGQCLALAVAVAEAQGQDSVYVEMIEDEITGEYRLLHAYAFDRHDEETLLDVEGTIGQWDLPTERDGRDIDGGPWSLDDARTFVGTGVPEQRFDIAATHAPLVIRKFGR